ncbi:hypothetical protein [Leekyejoonella antrihumi]|uniref:Uncharacterized protein n=1 Tax=Leekyejoonella antrihumi TaxID=1660198 RepID=A0A563DSH4_9MICO|nr:hypothetical protein [Leekyejoonella antrihumi]TWP33126.1 hypothetical protein FGL98_22270 [Leekyejoonella antrihumi]
MTEQWNDLMFRHNFDDTGKYPTAGTLSSSPDVIPLGDTPVSDPNTLIGDDAWKRDYGNSTNASESNYIYLRGMNPSTTDRSGQVSLYYSPASLLLWPTDPLDPKKGWAKNPLRTSGGDKSITVTAAANNGRFVTSQGFNWIPEPIYNDHYCVVARLVTDDNPNPLPTLGNLTDFAAYISQHPNMAWRNVVTINPSNPVTSTVVNYSQGTEGGGVYVILRCENVPDGSKVAFNCGTPGPDPMISIGPTTVANTVDSKGIPRFNLTLLTTIPANWASDVTYTWYSEGRNPAPDMKIWLDAVMPVASDHPLLGQYARPLTQFGIAQEHLGVGPTKGIMLGSQLMKTLPVAVNQSARYYGSSRRLIVPATAPSVLFSGVSWGQHTASIFGSQSTNYDIGVVRETNAKGVQSDVVTVSELATDPAPAPEQADVTVDAVLETGPFTGSVLATLTATNIPNGAEIWFKNLDGSVTIATPPTTISKQPAFTVSTIVDAVPAEYTTTIRCSLRLNGRTLPADYELKFTVLALSEEEIEARRAALAADPTAKPTPGKELGAVKLRP